MVAGVLYHLPAGHLRLASLPPRFNYPLLLISRQIADINCIMSQRARQHSLAGTHRIRRRTRDASGACCFDGHDWTSDQCMALQLRRLPKACQYSPSIQNKESTLRTSTLIYARWSSPGILDRRRVVQGFPLIFHIRNPCYLFKIQKVTVHVVTRNSVSFLRGFPRIRGTHQQ